MRILSSQVSEHVGEEVTVAGWLHRVRALKSVTFAVVRDRDGLVQVVAAEPELVKRLAVLTEETVVEVTGTVTANQQAPGGVEITSPTVRELSEPAVAPPFDLYRPVVSAALPTVLDNAAVALRHPRLRAPFEISAASVAGYRRALDRLGFTEVHTPKVVSSATESGANVFALDWFGRKAYLAQSPQFYKQTMVGVFERVYEVGPVFRAEPHDTARHLAQYTSLDAELGFVTDHRDVMAVVREAVAAMVATIAERAPGAVESLGVKLPDVPEEIPSIHFADAQELLARETDEDPRGEPDLAPAHERWLCDWAMREHGSQFLFVTGYPMRKRPFYTHPDPRRPEFSNSFDLLFRGLELVTGGQRLHRHSDYLAALEARGESPEPYAGYLAAFAHGMPPHGGFALGLERFVARLTEADNIRWTTLFPRDLHRLAP
ncbi:aspartate--tRNA(Asn) ligase [Microbispora sp. NBC_01389]|uniref:aspartate--tRNA(Asn) ligase n=1 Tax=Microbispora sp. NBC_01389 TaxID=2903584 RepID=UPI0032509677